MTTDSGNVEIYSDRGIPEGARARILSCIIAATEARRHASPLCSGFAVGAAILDSAGDIAAGCNYEYGAGFGAADTKSVHAEQSAISAAILKSGPKLKIQIVAVVAESARPFCCGNCLDAVMTYADENLMIAACGLDGTVVVKQIGDLFPPHFERVLVSSLPDQHARLLEKALESRFASSQMFPTSSTGLTGAAALSIDNKIYPGVREDTASFHPVTAIEGALINSRINHDAKLKAIAYVSENGYLCGRDRQKIFERADHYDMRGELTVINYAINAPHVEVCTAGALLPFGFSIKSIRG